MKSERKHRPMLILRRLKFLDGIKQRKRSFSFFVCRHGPGDYVVLYVWRGYADCIDVVFGECEKN